MTTLNLYPAVCISNECPVPEGHLTSSPSNAICGSSCKYWNLRQATIKAFLEN